MFSQSKLNKDAFALNQSAVKRIILTETLLSLPPMSEVIRRIYCPVCNSTNITPALTAKDYTVSHETFEIWQCADCTVRFTQDVSDEKSIGKYYQSVNYISHSDTKQGLINRLYHAARSYTLKAKRKLITKTSGLQTGNLLDVGAGTGAFAAIMQQAGWQLTGLEPDEAARKVALQKHNLQLQPLQTLPSFADNNFDVITLWHVLEHIHQLHETLQTFQRILQSNGTLIIAVPNYTSVDAGIYKEYWAAYDVPRHLYHFSPKSMGELIQQHGFSIMQQLPMWFDSFYVSMLSEKYKTGNNNLLSAFFNGLRSNIHASGNAAACSSVIYVMKKKPYSN